MEIISHRGYWKKNSEKNSFEAFQRSFSMGFGTEFDIRDYNGEIVISHDIANAEKLSLDEFINLYKKFDTSLTLAFNIKSDGLSWLLKDYLECYGIENYFCFDMSVPDMIEYFNAGINVHFRISEYEKESPLTMQSTGIWLDGFHRGLVNEENLINYIERGLKVCIVSPELHRRDHHSLWNKMKSFEPSLLSDSRIVLCTDYPEEAFKSFYGQ